MMARRGLLRSLLGGAITAGLSGCGLFTKRASYRFRMTIEADAGSGTGVLQVNAVKSLALTAHEHAGGAGLSGEAVVLNLPEGPIFALLTIGDGKPPLATRVTLALDPGLNALDPKEFVQAVDRLGAWLGGARAELPRQDWPMMVRFRDISNPKSVEPVDPGTIGVKRIVVETTGDEISIGITKKLHWLNSGGRSLDPGNKVDFSGGTNFAKELRQKYFSSEIGK